MLNMSVTTKMSLFCFFFHQMAFRDPSIIGASRCLRQHGQHLQDVSGRPVGLILSEALPQPSRSCSHPPVAFQLLSLQKKLDHTPVPNCPPISSFARHTSRWYALCLVSLRDPNHSWKRQCVPSSGMLVLEPQWGLDVGLVFQQSLFECVDSLLRWSLRLEVKHTWSSAAESDVCGTVMHEGRRRWTRRFCCPGGSLRSPSRLNDWLRGWKPLKCQQILKDEQLFSLWTLCCV